MLQAQLQAALPTPPDSNSQSERVAEACPSQQSAPGGTPSFKEGGDCEVAQLAFSTGVSGVYPRHAEAFSH